MDAPFIDGGFRDDGAPIGLLDGPEGQIKIVFNHYKSYQEGVEKWNERKERIHWGNIFYIMSDGNGLTESDIIRFGKVNAVNKIMFTAHNYPYDYTLSLKGFEDLDSAAIHMLRKHKHISTRYLWEDSFDYVAFLNKKIEG